MRNIQAPDITRKDVTKRQYSCSSIRKRFSQPDYVKHIFSTRGRCWLKVTGQFFHAIFSMMQGIKFLFSTSLWATRVCRGICFFWQFAFELTRSFSLSLCPTTTSAFSFILRRAYTTYAATGVRRAMLHAAIRRQQAREPASRLIYQSQFGFAISSITIHVRTIALVVRTIYVVVKVSTLICSAHNEFWLQINSRIASLINSNMLSHSHWIFNCFWLALQPSGWLRIRQTRSHRREMELWKFWRSSTMLVTDYRRCGANTHTV